MGIPFPFPYGYLARDNGTTQRGGGMQRRQCISVGVVCGQHYRRLASRQKASRQAGKQTVWPRFAAVHVLCGECAALLCLAWQ